MKVGDPIEVILPHSLTTFSGQRGRIASMLPSGVTAILEGDPRPIYFGFEAIMLVHPTPHHGGAE